MAKECDYLKSKRILRLASLIMLIIAIIFLSVALTHPEFGTTFYIGDLAIGSDIWRGFYVFYGIVMVALFVASFFLKDKQHIK